MRFTIILLIFFRLFSFSVSAQNAYSIKGVIADTASNAKLLNTSISVLNAKDSTLRTFTRAAANGSFAIGNLSKGKFILLVTYPGYADYVERFNLDSAKSTHDFGRLNMILKSKLLADVIIKGTRAAIKIKGDTTEFDARAFKIEPNAKVEDLLKQLPGIQVDQDGKITAQGQTVNKVLVDGEEFFGDDPTLVTKNIRADMVDKVQLYDKKSDQATFTGIDDGQKTKTINIKLKEDKKNGYFGKVDIGDATDGYYQGQLLFNKFKAKQKFSAYATLGNTGKTGLGWQDNQKYGSSDNLQVMDDGGLMISGGNDELESWNGQYDGKGIPLARTGGLHYDSKFNSDKESINANYKIGSLTVDGTDNTLTQNNKSDGPQYGVSDQTFHNSIFRQKLDGTYQVKLDTTSNLKIVVDGTLKKTQTRSNYIESNTRGNGIPLNDNNRSLDNNGNTHIFDASAFYTKKFKKKGRTFSLNISEAINQGSAKGYLKSDAHFFDATGKLDSVAHVDQYKTTETRSSVLITNLTYTEPLSKSLSAIMNYSLGVNNGTSDRKSFNPSAPGVYNVLVNSLSNNFKLNELSNEGGVFLNYKKAKTLLNFGSKVTNVNFNQVDENNGTVLKRGFVNWAPQARYQYRFSQQKEFEFDYQGNTTQPTIDQIQPVIVNTDNLNTTRGNPNLKPSFTNRISMNYNSYKVLSGQSVYLYGSYSFTSNPIASNLLTDSAGKTVNQYVNLSSKKQTEIYFYISTGRKLEKADIYLGFDLNVNGNNSYNLSNNDLNLTKSFTYTGNFRVSKYVQKKYNFNINFGPNYTFGGSSLTPQINNNGRGFDARGSFLIYLPGKFQVGSDGNYQWRGKTETFHSDFSRTLINASLSKTFFKEDNLKISLSGNDLLNQNAGFSRDTNGNLITQNTYTTIKRYYMISLIWDFNKMGGVTAKK